MNPKKKKPKVKNYPTIRKAPKTAYKHTKLKFSWSFSILDKEGPFGWNKCQCHNKLLEILEKKGNFEDKELSELYYQGSHSIPVAKICKEAQKRLEEINQDDIDNLFSFRLTGINRIFCIQDGNIMKVLWWDPDHMVCPSIKRHT